MGRKQGKGGAMEQAIAFRPAETVSSPDQAYLGPATRLLFVGPAEAVPDYARAGARLVAALAPADAAAHIRAMIAVDIVWLADADAIDEPSLADIAAAVIERDCRLVCETGLAALDRVAAAIPPAVRAEWLVEADAADRLVALAAASPGAALAVHDVARDEAMERIDRLQEEVARISRLLGDLAGQRGLAGGPGGLAMPPSDDPGRAVSLRSPGRDYAAAPRSFVPEDRATDRQRAKAVRRLLRQRRIREQYFPADLFADPAWDMLLDLYAARLERRPVSVSSLCIAAAVPATTALRWIKTMTDAGLFVREADPNDGRRIFIALADGAADAMTRYFEALEE